MTRVVLLGAEVELTRTVAEQIRATEDIASCEIGKLPELAAADVVVYLGSTLGARAWAPSVEEAGTAFAAIAESGTHRAIVVSSAAISPPRHVHPGMVPEVRRAARGFNPVSDGWSEFEAEAQRWLQGLELTVLRPAATPTSDGRDYFSRLLRSSFATSFAGYDPPLQLLSAEDLGRAIATAVLSAEGGVFNVAPAGVIPSLEVFSCAGTVRLPLPTWVQRLGRWLLAPFGLASMAEAERLRYSSTVSGSKIERELDFRPQYSSAQVARSLGRGESLESVPEPPTYDVFGQSRSYIGILHRTVLGFLHNVWWRVEVDGIENVPEKGAAVLTGIHRGFMPFDGTMALYDLVGKRGRYPRFLIHPSLIMSPFLSNFITRQGGVIACRQNSDFLLQSGEILGVFPEGVEGAFSYYRDAYTLRKDFGRDEFVKAALRNQIPIVPFVTVGSAEIFPIVAKIDWQGWCRVTGWPCFPIAPPFPLLPFPFPSKWHTLFLEPIPVQERYGPEAAEDREVVSAISADVRGRLQTTLTALRERRKSIFFGSIFERKA